MTTRRRPGTSTAAGAAAVLAFGLLVLATSGEPATPILSYDGESYLSAARRIAFEGKPPSIDMRPPIYPALLAAFLRLGGSSPLVPLVHLQRGLWLATGLMVFAVVQRLQPRQAVAVAAGVAYLTDPEVFDLTQLVYAETLAILFSVASMLALVAAPGSRGRHAAAWLAVASAWVRPIGQLLLLPIGAAAVLASRGYRGRLRAAIPFAVAGLIGIGSMYGIQYLRTGIPSFVPIAGKCHADYLGDRRLLGHFPPGYAPVERLYAQRFEEQPDSVRIGWWDVAREWPEAYRERTGRPLAPEAVDLDMGRTARAVLLANPGFYLSRWREVWQDFSTTVAGPVKGRFCPISLATPAWAVWWTWFGAWAPFALVALEAILFVRGVGSPLRGLPAVTYALLSVANTALESWPGQIRYRTQFVAFLVCAVALVPSGLGLLAGRTRTPQAPDPDPERTKGPGPSAPDPSRKWRRRESNPRPKELDRTLLHA